jgi:hypothetical protein
VWNSGLPLLGAGWLSVRTCLISRPAVETEDMMGTTGVMVAWNSVRHFVGMGNCSTVIHSAVGCAPSSSKRRGATKTKAGQRSLYNIQFISLRRCDGLVLSAHLDVSWVMMVKDPVEGIKVVL